MSHLRPPSLDPEHLRRLILENLRREAQLAQEQQRRLSTGGLIWPRKPLKNWT
jgi:hypothetical protein